MSWPAMSNRSLVAMSLLVSACATSGRFGDEPTTPAPHARVTLASLRDDPTVRVVPHAIEPMLPSADRLARVIRNRVGETATVDVRYCVAPSGRLVSAELLRRSTLAAFDQAVMADIMTWTFATRPGPEHLRTCQSATIIYRART